MADSSVTGKVCPICLNRIEVRSAAVIIPCRHAYCVGCIRRWSELKRSCPLCNANFASWIRKPNDDNNKHFRVEKLLPISSRGNASSIRRDDDAVLRSRRAQFFQQRRLIRRCREASGVQSESRVLPRQRSFGRAGHENPDVIAERIRQWRSSIYEQRLHVVPPPPRNGLMKQMLGNNAAKETILRRIEPWVHRELQAILGDPDPTVIVHVATSLYISRHEKQHRNFHGQVGAEDDFLASLRPFLHEQTDIFWHELRCYADSSFSLETYDTVVEYERLD